MGPRVLTIPPDPVYIGAMDPLAPLIDALHGEGRLRVWSMVITVFGDLVQHRGGEVSAARLGRILGRVGVGQGALRTAISRLGRDGWVESRRAGRTGFYRLSREGQDRFGPATARIYAPPRDGLVGSWAVAVTLDPGGRVEAKLCPAEEAPIGADCVVTGRLDKVSEPYRAALLSPDHRDALVALAADLDHLSGAGDLPPEDAAAARMLLVHRWRRIVLRYADIPAELMPGDAPLADPRRAVAAVYGRLIPASERWLEDGDGGLPPMPAADPPATQRFGLSARG